MTISNSAKETNFDELITSGVDMTVLNTVTVGLDISLSNTVYIQVSDEGGDHDTHVVTLQTSSDDISYEDTAHTISGIDDKDNIQIAAKFVRLKVTTAEPPPVEEEDPASCKLSIQAKEI